MESETTFTEPSITKDCDNIAEEIDFVFSDTKQRIIVASMFLFIAVAGTIGNSLVILSVLASKKLRTTTNVFVVNLAVADLLTSLCVPWNAVALLGFNGLPIPEMICSIAAGVLFTCIGCSLYTLASIAVYRVFLITRPFRANRKQFNRNVIAIILVLIWIVPCCIVIIPPFFDIGELGYNTKYFTCTGKSSHHNSNIFDLIVAAALYPIPLITIIGSYTIIYIYLGRHFQRMHNLEAGEIQLQRNYKPERFDQSREVTSSHVRPISEISVNTNISDDTPRTTIHTASRPHVSRRQIEVTKNLFYVVCAFIVCITPFSIGLVYEHSDPAIPYTGAFILFNSCINPIIYAIKHPYFKQVFKYIVLCQWRKIPEPADFLKFLTSRSK